MTTDRELRQDIDLLVANVQEILEILPTLATKQDIADLKSRVTNIERNMATKDDIAQLSRKLDVLVKQQEETTGVA